MIATKLNDGAGNGHNARVTHAGELVTVRGNYDEASQQSMNVINTAYNLATTKANKRFVITGIIINADKNVSATDGAVINLYEATSDTSTTATKAIITLNIGKNESEVITGILIQITQGVYINAKTDDATVNITLLGYYLQLDAGRG